MTLAIYVILFMTHYTSVIRDSGLYAFGLIAKQQDVLKHLNGSKLAKQYQESPYMLLYQFSFVRLAMKIRQLGATESISFVCDENTRYLGILARSYSGLRALNKLSAAYMGSCTTDIDENCMPLQMADLIVGEIRKNARTWNSENRSFGEPLRLLLDSETLGWVSLVDESVLAQIRTLVDSDSRPINSRVNGD
jgi:hypothetical protein